MNDIIVTKDLTKRFRDIQALRGINLRVGKGITGYIGPNGAGKTVTIRILLGYLKPTSGEAYMFGYDCWRESIKIRRYVGVMLENPVFPKALSCGKYLKTTAELRGYSGFEAERISGELLEFVGLKEASHRPIGKLSAGMYRRFALAHALVGEPEFLILDEPTANMDVLGRMDMLRKINELHRKKVINVMVSSHILPELEEICTHVVIINNGILLDCGEIEHLLYKYGLSVKKYEIICVNIETRTIVDLLNSSDAIEEMSIKKKSITVKIKNRNKFIEEIGELSKLCGTKINIREVNGERKLGELFKRILKEREQNEA